MSNLLHRRFAGSELDLEQGPEGRVGGYLIWDGFKRLEQIDRQHRVQKVLREELTPAEQLKVNYILTLTPDEWTAAREG